MTPARRRVLVGVLAAPPGTVLGAYDILERMAATGPRPAPMSIYRALEFLRAEGLVHRLASLNAFVACTHPQADGGGGHPAQFLICHACRSVTEVEGAAVTRVLKGRFRPGNRTWRWRP